MTQIAVKLPDSLVADVDRLVATGAFASRSDAVRRALGAAVRAAERRRIDDAFLAGYAAHPETDDEIADATRLAVESIEEEPWEKWW